MLILGIDPGTARLGFGLVEVSDQVSGSSGQGNGHLKFVHAGCLETSKDSLAWDRLWYLQQEIEKILIEHKPDVLAIEQLFFGINSRTAMAVGQARGVVLAIAAKHKVPIFEYQGLSVKFAVTGSGKSDKKQIQEAVKKILKMKDIVKPDDAADGLAIAIAHHIKSNAPQVPIAKGKTAKAKASKKKV